MKYDDEIRYSRHITLSDIGKDGQEKLLASKVLVIGAGGLGSPLLLYLAAAGVGHIGIVDDDVVDLSNLQRQVLHETSDIGDAKVESAKAALLDLNPEIDIVGYKERLTVENATELLQDYDIIADGSDNFSTRFLVARTCYQLAKPLVSAAVRGFSGQMSTYTPYLGAEHPCYECLVGNDAEALIDDNCQNAGVLGAAAGVMGTWQAVEVIKELLGIGESLSGKLLTVNFLDMRVKMLNIPRNPECLCCA